MASLVLTDSSQLTSDGQHLDMAVYIQHVDTGFVLDVKESNPDPGAEVTLYEYYSTPNQHWELRDGRILSQLSSLVLDVEAGTRRVTPAEQSDAPSQQWQFQEDGTVKNGAGQFLEVVSAGEDGLESLIAADYSGSPAQIFKTVPAESS
uniref:Ricin B lectin domain-containing protein n=1 Tax=Timema shepardi TaxID=629360 RepID=A0A7R9B065_TIMSH|nr:unnamed protein product [Timema shepardi]